MPEPLLSVVIPLYNEAPNVAPLLTAIATALTGTAYEIIAVDDGSTDDTAQRLEQGRTSQLRIIRFEKNQGQTAAIAKGIETAAGQYIVTMDSDLQNDPADILPMLNLLLREQCDLVVGWRQSRHDNIVLRKFPSWVANGLIRQLFGVTFHDQGCTLKLFKATTAKRIKLTGQLHRFIPLLAHFQGAKIIEMPVRHHPRRFGTSKYGIKRTVRVIKDVSMLWYLSRFQKQSLE